MTRSEIKACRHDLLDDVQWLKDQISDPDNPLDRKVEAAMILWDLSELARAALDPFKEELRALADASGESKWQYYTENAQATVVRPSARVKLKRGADISNLRNTPEYTDLIEEVTTYRVRPTASTENLSNDWLDVLSVEKPTPRVSLCRQGNTARRK